MWKRVGIGVGVVALVIVGWKLIKPLFRSEATKRLETHHRQQRDRLGSGLDPLFEEQIDAGDNRVEFHASFEISKELEGYSTEGCAPGFDAAFEDVLGLGVVKVGLPSSETEDNPRLELTAKITPGTSTFQMQNSRASYSSIAMSGDIDLGGVKAHIEVSPPTQIDVQYTAYGDVFHRSSATPDDVRKGIMQGACREAGYALLEAVTTWKRPAARAALDPVEACKKGIRCREAGDALAASEPEKAAELYTEACIAADDDSACLKAASLVTANRAFDSPRALLALGCRQRRSAPCLAAAHVALIPRYAGGQVHQRARLEALRYLLRACDRGLLTACERAVPLLEETPFAEAAQLPVTDEPIKSKRFGTIFALRWGEWTELGPAQPTAWVTKRPQRLDPVMLVREFRTKDLPASIVAPPGVETVYAVALEGGERKDPCERCNADQESNGLIAGPEHCVCALDRP